MVKMEILKYVFSNIPHGNLLFSLFCFVHGLHKVLNMSTLCTQHINTQIFKTEDSNWQPSTLSACNLPQHYDRFPDSRNMLYPDGYNIFLESICALYVYFIRQPISKAVSNFLRHPASFELNRDI